MKRILIIATLLLTLFVSCTKAEFGSSINDIIGTEWSFTDDGGTIGLKFYANNAVTSFLDNQYGIATVSGTYEYIESTKTLSFNGLIWYYAETGQVAMEMTGAHIIDSRTMEVVCRTDSGTVEKDNLYRK